MLILNQDRDELVEYRGELYTLPAIFKKQLYGINLFLGEHLLGTFDSVQEAMEEIGKIQSCVREVYVISGYSAWETERELEALMREILAGIAREED